MRLASRLFRCEQCGHEWQGQVLLDCPVALATRVLKALRCPYGHANRYVLLLFGDAAIQAAARLAETTRWPRGPGSAGREEGEQCLLTGDA